MATLGSNVLTLMDYVKRRNPDGQIASVIELLSQSNEILLDMLWREGNLTTGHRVTVRTGLPTTAWRLLNQGVQPSKSTTAQVDEGTGMLEAWSEVDEDLAKLEDNVAMFRLSEAMAFIEAMNQEMASTLFFGNSGLAAEEFTGFSVRYSDLSASNSQNIIDGGGTGSDNSSIWLVGWGEQSVYGIYPKGTQAGLERNDMGIETVENVAGVGGARMRAFREQFKWKAGLALKDWRFTVRIPNIDISNLVAESGSADLRKLMIKATHRIHNLSAVTPVFYMNRSLFQFLDLERVGDVEAGGGITFDNVDGRRIASFRGIPIRQVDVLTETEARVV